MYGLRLWAPIGAQGAGAPTLALTNWKEEEGW